MKNPTRSWFFLSNCPFDIAECYHRCRLSHCRHPSPLIPEHFNPRLYFWAYPPRKPVVATLPSVSLYKKPHACVISPHFFHISCAEKEISNRRQNDFKFNKNIWIWGGEKGGGWESRGSSPHLGTLLVVCSTSVILVINLNPTDWLICSLVAMLLNDLLLLID
jgi:hypothetical protein